MKRPNGKHYVPCFSRWLNIDRRVWRRVVRTIDALSPVTQPPTGAGDGLMGFNDQKHTIRWTEQEEVILQSSAFAGLLEYMCVGDTTVALSTLRSNNCDHSLHAFGEHESRPSSGQPT